MVNLILNNVRFSDGVRVDLHAMIGCNHHVRKRIMALLDMYGKETVLASVKEMMKRTEIGRCERRFAKFPMASIPVRPRPTTTAPCSTSRSGFAHASRCKGDEMTIDLSESDAQRRGFINSVYAATYGNTIAAAILYFDPAIADYHNQGTMEPIKVIAPLGSVVNCQYPATVGASPVNVGIQVMEAVLEALSKAVPHRAVAAWGKHRGDYVFAVDPRTGERYVRTSFDYDGSGGAVWGFDGYQAVSTMTALGAAHRDNVEEMEVRVPWRALRWEFVPDFDRRRPLARRPGLHWEAVNEGSDGQMATGSSDGDVVQGFGALVVSPSPVSRTYLRRNGEDIRVKPHRLVPVKTGDVLVKHSPAAAASEIQPSGIQK